MKEIIAPISTENIIENPIVIPSNFTKNKSNSIWFVWYWGLTPGCGNN